MTRQEALNENLRKDAEYGDLAALRDALAAGANAKAQGENGFTALMSAARYGHTDCVRALLPVSDIKAQDTKGWPALMWAAPYGHTDCVRALLLRSDAKAQGEDGVTALMLAAQYGHTDCVRELLLRSDANVQDVEGCTALMLAASNGESECVRELLPHCDLYLVNDSNQSALDRALAAEHAQCVDPIAADPRTAPDDRAKAMRLFTDEHGQCQLPRCVAFAEQQALADVLLTHQMTMQARTPKAETQPRPAVVERQAPAPATRPTAEQAAQPVRSIRRGRL